MLSNAVKYTNEHGKINLDISEKKLNDEEVLLIIIVEDNGIGMSSEQIAHLFQTETPSESHTHSSIALNNVQQRIQYHYGSAYGITVQSTLGKNTIVVIQIPY